MQFREVVRLEEGDLVRVPGYNEVFRVFSVGLRYVIVMSLDGKSKMTVKKPDAIKASDEMARLAEPPKTLAEELNKEYGFEETPSASQ